MMTTITKDPIQLHDLQVRFLLDDVDTGGLATVFETYVPSGCFVPPPHRHEAFEETVYVTEGEFTFVVDDRTIVAPAGTALFIARGQVHHFANHSGVDGRFVSVATPGVFRPAYFLELAELLAPTNGAHPDRQALAEIMRRHGLTPVVPAPPAG